MISRVPLGIWFIAARPKTLGASVAPVVIGTAMAYADGYTHRPSVVCALVGALLIQIGTNFANDYFDHAKGIDTVERAGPTRVTQAGLVSPETMRRATMLVFLAVLAPGAYIIWRGGWPFVVIGLLSILFGVWYTAGPYPLGYLGLGDILVLIFFGPVAVAGTYYLVALELEAHVVLAGLAPGLLSVALLTVNNLRDIEGDRRAGKKTLAVRFGPAFARWEYLVCLVVACLGVPLYLYAHTQRRLFALVAIIALALATPAIRTIFTHQDSETLNRVLAKTGKLLLVFSILFTLGCVL